MCEMRESEKESERQRKGRQMWNNFINDSLISLCR